MSGAVRVAEAREERAPHRRLSERRCRHQALSVGWIPQLAVCGAVGLLLCTAADALSRSTVSSSQTLFWLGLLAIFTPIVARLCLSDTGRGERLVLVCLLGVLLYLVKIARDPSAFSYTDELAHAPNVNAILRTHELFHGNPILPITAYYPGLESVTAALASMGGMTVFGAGLIVIGTARLVIMLGLYLLYERVSGSSRVAAVAAAMYAANANFLFFSAQFSYESMALPLMAMTLFAVAQWQAGDDGISWSIVATVGAAAVVVTHHMTSYALVIVLAAVCIASVTASRRERRRVPWRIALFALDSCFAWLVFVASATVGYLTPVFTNALTSTIRTLSGESAPRQLFDAGGYSAPILERATGIASVVLLAAALAFGLRTLYRRYRREPIAVVFGAAAIMYFGMLGLRFAPAAWETANRASEFLFIGLSLIVALTRLERWSPGAAPWLGAIAVSGCASVVFVGGVIAGWDPNLRLSQPYRIDAGGHVIEPVGRELARWAETQLGPGRRFAADPTNARLLATYANEDARSGSAPDIQDVLQTPTLPAWEAHLLRENRLRYVVVDRRPSRFATVAFTVRPAAPARDDLLPPGVAGKFDRIGADRLFDAGVVRVYDVETTPLWKGSG
jgi:hypothetical protein